MRTTLTIEDDVAKLLIYAHVNNFPQHSAAKGWLDQCLNAKE
jgi:predicted nucleic acid-binding protein